MRLTPILVAVLPATTALAAEASPQVPLTDRITSWFTKAKSYIPNPPPNPIDIGAARAAAHKVTILTTRNWQDVLSPSKYPPQTSTTIVTPGAAESIAGGRESWMVLVTGQNRTCGRVPGGCQALNAEFNKTAALFAANPAAPHLGLVDCDVYAVLCSTWFAGPPSLWYIQLPVVVPGEQSPARTDVYVKHLNATTTKAVDLVRFHKEKQFLEMDPIDSFFDPFNGPLVKYHLHRPLGYVLFAFSMVPSWSIMLLVSFVTRYFMHKRIGAQQDRANARAGTAPNMANIPLGGAPAANEKL